MKKDLTPLDIVLNVVKILIPLLLLAFITVMIVSLCDARLDDLNHDGEGIYIKQFGIAAVLLGIISAIACGIAEVVLVIGIITSRLYKSSSYRKKHTRHFLLLLIAPLLMFGIYIAAASIISVVG